MKMAQLVLCALLFATLGACTGPVALTNFGSNASSPAIESSDALLSKAKAVEGSPKPVSRSVGRDAATGGREVASLDEPSSFQSVLKPRTTIHQGEFSNSEFVRQNKSLFSIEKDHEPWPAVDSPEGRQQQAQERERDKELKKAIHICNC